MVAFSFRIILQVTRFCYPKQRVDAMFKVTHQKYLEESIWGSVTTGRVEFVEVWKYAGVCGNSDRSHPVLTGWDNQEETCTADNNRRGFLNDWEIKDWLHQNASPVSDQYSAFKLGT